MKRWLRRLEVKIRHRHWLETTVVKQYDLICDLEAQLDKGRRGVER